MTENSNFGVCSSHGINFQFSNESQSTRNEDEK